MATSMNRNSQPDKSTIGLLLIVGDIISNEQREELCLDLQRAFQHVDMHKYHEIIDLFNNLIHENEFQADSQYRQMAATENGSMAGFLYLPNFHTVINVLKDLFNMCYRVCIIFCGQQIDFNGALILSDSLFTSENFRSLFEENPSYFVQDLHIILPLISNQWKQLADDYLEKQLKNIQINDSSNEINATNAFGELFYERLYGVLNKASVNFDIYAKLIPRNSSGTIAFDEPNLYILYGQQGEASLFGIRGFVVLVNGGFSRIPSYWNLIRGLQSIDACILTHFDYDVFPGLQTIIHRKTIATPNDEQVSKPDIGAIFLNQIQRAKLSPSKTSNRKLSVDLNENIDQFSKNVKQLNINTFDLIKHPIPNKLTIEPINLFKKIAFGSLDFYVLHPTASTQDDEKLLASLQKIPIRNQQSSSSVIPLHHWYSACSLLVWTPSSKSNKDNVVRILYTGACPQTLVFEALEKVRNLEFLHVSQSQQQTVRTSNIKPTTSTRVSNVAVKQQPLKPKVSPPITNRVTTSTVQNKTPKAPPRPTNPKPKATPITKTSTAKPRPASVPKKASPPKSSNPLRPINKEKKIEKPRQSPSKPKPKQVKKPPQKPKATKDQKKTVVIKDKPIEVPKISIDHEEKLETPIEHSEELIIIENDHPQNLEEEKLEIADDHPEELVNTSEQKSEFENKDEQPIETETNEEPKFEIHNDEYDHLTDHEQSASSHYDNHESMEEKNETEMSADELDEPPIDIHEDEIKRPETISMTNGHNEPFIESNKSSPIDELKSQLSPHDPMTKGFVEGDSNTENPFIEKTADNEEDEMEIIHHDLSTSNNHSIPPSIEEINPQGLPIENNLHSNKKLNRSTGPSKPTSGSIFHVDVAYIPYHGHEHYVDSEFFRRIRARYYILNAVQINHLTLESLLDGKEQWEKSEDLPVTLVPTYDGEQLRQFFVTNKTRLSDLNITILPASIRCNVQYDDEGSPAQRLRFNSIEHFD